MAAEQVLDALEALNSNIGIQLARYRKGRSLRTDTGRTPGQVITAAMDRGRALDVARGQARHAAHAMAGEVRPPRDPAQPARLIGEGTAVTDLTEITVECQRCRKTLADVDEDGWFYQQPVTSPEAPGLTFMDRVRACGSRPHVVRPEDDLGCVAARWQSIAMFLDDRAKLLADKVLAARAALYRECAAELRPALSRALPGEEDANG